MQRGRPGRGGPAAGSPELDIDLYADEVLADSTETFARIRDAGEVVWLPRHRMYAMGRFDGVRAALRNDTVFQSGRGVAANPFVNLGGRGTTLFSDGDTHAARRRVLMRSLGARALAAVEPELTAEAERLIDELVARRRFESARDFAGRLPVAVIARLVGVPGGSDRLLRWAASTFDSLGPLNLRTARAMRRALGLFAYSQRLRRETLLEGSWAASVFDARDRGEISTREARALVIDFVAPSLDTTILASTHLLWSLAGDPEAWSAVRSEPDLVPAAVMENMRIASPIRGFTRRLAADHDVDGVTLPTGARVVLLFAAANLDETQFPDPLRFDLARTGAPHLGWGNGPHACVGMLLAKLEMHALLRAMIPRVAAVEVGAPRRLRNNTLQGFAELPAGFRAAA